MTALDEARTLREQIYLGADPTRISPVGRTKHERGHLATMERRIAYLRRLEADGQANDWDKAERSALIWALARIAEAERAELPEDVQAFLIAMVGVDVSGVAEQMVRKYLPDLVKGLEGS